MSSLSTALTAVPLPPVAALDLEQELILIRRFEDAIASFAETEPVADEDQRRAHHERERAWRIATNMRGHIR